MLIQLKGKMNNLEVLAIAIQALKKINPDGKIVGRDSVSGDKYFENFISLGTTYKTPSGKYKVIVDAIFYPKHTSDKGKVYDDEVRFITYEFDPDTLELKGSRNNVGYNFIKAKCEIINTSLVEYVMLNKLKKNEGKAVLSI